MIHKGVSFSQTSLSNISSLLCELLVQLECRKSNHFRMNFKLGESHSYGGIIICIPVSKKFVTGRIFSEFLQDKYRRVTSLQSKSCRIFFVPSSQRKKKQSTRVNDSPSRVKKAHKLTSSVMQYPWIESLTAIAPQPSTPSNFLAHYIHSLMFLYICRADIKQYIGLPSVNAVFSIYHSCITELMRVRIFFTCMLTGM